MATIIDELIVRLGIDSKDLTIKGGNATKTLKEIGKTSKESASSVTELTGVFTKFLAVVGGATAIKFFVSDLIQSSAALDRLSKNLNVSAGEITAWSNAAEQLGGSAKGVQASMSMLSKAQTDIQLTGESGLIPYFNYLGVSLADASGRARKVTDVLADLSSVAEGKDRRQMVNIFAKMGFDESTINLLVSGRKELDISLAHQKEYADQMRKFTPEATKLQRSLVDLKQQFTLLGLSLLQQAAPALERVLGVLSSVGSWVSANRQFIGDFLKVMAVGLGAIALATLPFDGVVLAITAVGAAIALLWQDYQTFQHGGQSLIPWNKWKPGIDAAIEAAKTLGKIWVTELMAIAGAVSFVQKALNGDWGGAQKALASWTEKMNRKWGIAGPNEANDQNASKADGLVKKGAKWVKSTVRDVGSHGAGFEVPGQKTLGEAIAQIEGFNAKGKTANRPQRNHNPGDIEYGDFAKAHGATGSDGRFAIFPDDETGKQALYALLKSSKYANLTIDQAIAKFAPPNENNTKGYQASVHKMTGLAGSTMVSQALNGIPGASRQAAQAANSGSSGTSNDNRVTNTIGSVTINAPSGDAHGIAHAFRSLDIFPAVAAVGVR